MTRSLSSRLCGPAPTVVRLGPMCAAACVLALAASVQVAAAISRSERAAQAYERALRLRVALETHPAGTPDAYQRVVRAFQLVAETDPGYEKAPAALAAAAEVYEEMGRRFASDRYYTKAAEVCQFLAAQYPGGLTAIDALYTEAEIYRKDLENPIAARGIYEKFLKVYPHSRHSPDARAHVAEIDRKLARWPRARAPESHGLSVSSAAPARPESVPEHAAAVETETVPDTGTNPVPLGGSSGSTGDLEEVESIRHWEGPSYTRVVIRLGGKVTFNATHLEHPPRLVFDLAGARLSPDLARKVFPVENGFLERIRAAQFQPTVTRVVLDVPQIENYSVFSLPDPFRLVIDIHGGRPTLAAEASKNARSPTSASPAHTSGARAETARSTEPDGAVGSPGDHSVSGGASPSGSDRAAEPGDLSAIDAASPIASPPASASPTLTRALGLKIRRIVIDPGHGGHDTGTIGPTGLEEKNVVLDVALRLRRLIERRMGCQVIMTRNTDTFIPLEERTAIANESGADLFISIHANSSPDPSARGIEIYYLNFTSDPEALSIAARENATSRESVYQLRSLVKKIALSEKIGESRQLARIVDTRLVSYLDEYADDQPNRGVKKAPFVVLIGANMPSILAEISFLSNPTDESLLGRGSYREKIALGLYHGVRRYSDTLGTLRVAQDDRSQSAGSE